MLGIDYVWEVDHHPEDCEALEMPDWFLKKLQAPNSLIHDDDCRDTPKAAISTNLDIQKGTRNDGLLTIAGSMRQAGMSSDEISTSSNVSWMDSPDNSSLIPLLRSISAISS